MRRGLVWSLIFIVGVAIASLAATIGLGHTPLLGLDLKGGVSVVLKPQGTTSKSQLNTAVAIIERRVNGLGVSNSEVEVQGSNVVINLPGIKDAQSALATIGTTAQLLFRPVYCEVPAHAAPTSTSATTAPKPSPAPTTVPPRATPGTSASGRTSSATEAGVATATSSRAAAGTSSATGAHDGSAPGAAQAAPYAHLTSALVSSPAAAPTTAAPSTTPITPTTATTPTTAPTSSSTTPVPASGVSQADCSSSNAAALPTTPVSRDTKNQTVILAVAPKAFPQTPDIRMILGPADMTGSAVSGASAVIDTTTGQYSVNLTLTSKGAAQFDNIASARYACYQRSPSNPPPCSLEAFELDGTVVSAPTFQASSFNGNVSISGSFSSSQASALADELKYGALPVRFVPQSVQTVSATIGKDSLRAGLLAGIGGLIVVMLYMILYYRVLGLVVLVGLAVGGAILYSIIATLGQSSNPYTLTLAGITGIIVAIGITVDSYVVYFERLKDEVRGGRSVRQSTERSFSRAFRTVLTADLVSFMAALILYLLTVGDVRGFAFTLGLSTLLDVAVAFLFIKPAVIFVGRRRAFTENRWFGISRNFAARTEPGEV
jgi:preprotein translocase subunit SecD